MFYIDSPQGRIFSGPLEQLRRVIKVEHSVRPRSVKGDHLGEETEETLKGFIPKQRKLDAYLEVLQKDTAHREAIYHAYQIMSQPVITINLNSSMAMAYDQFQHHSFHTMPVLDNNQKLTASLSRHHLYQALINRAGIDTMWNGTIAELLTKNNMKVLSADPVTDVRRIASVLIDQKLEAIPIVRESGPLVGIVSRTDLLKCLIGESPLSLWG